MPTSKSPIKAAHLLRGAHAEKLAHEYLLAQGLQSVTRNFRCLYGELDLIMRDANTLVIIEVRYRKNNQYGGALASITQKKQQRIIASTQVYLIENKLDCPVRFDVVAMTANNQLDWLKNAFLLEYL